MEDFRSSCRSPTATPGASSPRLSRLSKETSCSDSDGVSGMSRGSDTTDTDTGIDESTPSETPSIDHGKPPSIDQVSPTSTSGRSGASPNVADFSSISSSECDTDSLIARSIVATLPDKAFTRRNRSFQAKTFSTSQKLPKSSATGRKSTSTKTFPTQTISQNNARSFKLFSPTPPNSGRHIYRPASKKASHRGPAAGGFGTDRSQMGRWTTDSDSVSTPQPASFNDGHAVSPSAHMSPAASENSSNSFSFHSSGIDSV